MFSRQQRTSASARNQADGLKSAEGHATVSDALVMLLPKG